MKNGTGKLICAGMAFALAFTSTWSARAQTVSPLKQVAATDHWLMSTFELVSYGDRKFHHGVDIVGVPFVGTAHGDIVVVAADGSICWDESRHWGDDNEEANLIVFDSGAAQAYLYEHLDPEHVDPAFDGIWSGTGSPPSCGEEICAGTNVSGVSPRDFYATAKRPHLHFAYSRGDCESDETYLDPTGFLDPFVDTRPPVIEEAWICDDDVETAAALGTTPIPEWQNCEELSAWLCPTIIGHRDIIVKLEDRHHAEGGTEFALGVRKLEWCVASFFSSTCTWNDAFDFSVSGLPWAWTSTAYGDEITDALYSFVSPFVSETAEDNYGSDEFWFIATNGDLPTDPDIDPDRENFADLTTAGPLPLVRVRATDFDGNETSLSSLFCATIGPVVRDCSNDLGFAGDVNSCTLFTDGPDIAFRVPVELIEPDIPPPPEPPIPVDFPLSAGTELPVQVCMTARGPSGLALTEPIDVRLFIGRTLPGIMNDEGKLEMLHDPVADRSFNPGELRVRDGSLPEGPWMPGEERCAGLTMHTPVRFESLSALDGLILYAMISTPSNALHPTTDVRRDPQKAGRSLRRMFEEVAALITTHDPATRRSTDSMNSTD